MADRPLKLRELRKILKRYDVREDESRGKGSHTVFFREVDGMTLSFPVPTNKSDLEKAYQRSLRKKLRLRSEDGTSDSDFYGS